MSLENGKCDRCNESGGCLTMSVFNTEMICLVCEDKEKEHIKYSTAREAEREAIKNGNYNFRGIGKPSDL